MNQKNQRGVALILAMIMLAVVSVMAVSMMFLSQSETWSTMNYRLMSQARDAAEAGLNRSANFLMDTTTQYVPAPGAAGDALTNYTYNTSPVTGAGGAPVMLTASNYITLPSSYVYPNSTAQSAYNTDGVGYGSITAGNQVLRYGTYAELLSMKSLVPFGSPTPVTLQRWKITSEGRIAGIQGAAVQVSAILDRPTTPTFAFAAFGTSNDCTPVGLTFGGNSMTNSFDSRTYNGAVCGGGAPTTSSSCGTVLDSGGNVGTNGALDVTGGTVDINGSLSTPRTGVGSCAGGFAVDDPNVIADGVNQLPQELDYPTPGFPTAPPAILTNQALPNNASTCPGIPGCGPVSPATKNNFLLQPGSYGNLSGGSNTKIHVTAGVYTINSLTQGAQAEIIIDGPGPVIFNISGCATLTAGSPPPSCATELAIPFAATGGGITNPTYNPSAFQVNYGGTGTIQMHGTTGLATLVYAPNGTFTTFGTTDFFGAVIANTVNMTGTANIHYDRALQDGAQMPGNYLLQAFTWRKF